MDAVLLESLGVAAVTVAACVARGTASRWPALLRRAGIHYLQQHGQSCVGRSNRSEPAAPVQWVVSVAVGVRWVVSVEVGDAQASCDAQWMNTKRSDERRAWFTMHSRAIVPPLRPAARARLPTAGATCNGTRGPSAARRRRRLHSCQRNGRCRAPASASLSARPPLGCSSSECATRLPFTSRGAA